MQLSGFIWMQTLLEAIKCVAQADKMPLQNINRVVARPKPLAHERYARPHHRTFFPGPLDPVTARWLGSVS
jgi:hypothetical protein